MNLATGAKLDTFSPFSLHIIVAKFTPVHNIVFSNVSTSNRKNNALELKRFSENQPKVVKFGKDRIKILIFLRPNWVVF